MFFLSLWILIVDRRNYKFSVCLENYTRNATNKKIGFQWSTDLRLAQKYQVHKKGFHFHKGALYQNSDSTQFQNMLRTMWTCGYKYSNLSGLLPKTFSADWVYLKLVIKEDKCLILALKFLETTFYVQCDNYGQCSCSHQFPPDLKKLWLQQTNIHDADVVNGKYEQIAYQLFVEKGVWLLNNMRIEGFEANFAKRSYKFSEQS